MERIDRILNNEIFKRCVRDIKTAERERVFCRHGMDHFLAVARIACLIAYEENIDEKKDVIYAAALLHDIGRASEYSDGTVHEEVSAELSGDILRDAGYTEKETARIAEAIIMHGDSEAGKRQDLAGILYRGDKFSRDCFMCN